MAILNVGKTWHLRYLESYVSLMLEKNEFSSPASVRLSENVPKVIEHAEGAIKQPNLLEDGEKSIVELFLTEFKFGCCPCINYTVVDGQKKYERDLVSPSGWDEQLIVLKSRIQGTFLPKIQEMALKRSMAITLKADTNQKASDNAGDIKTEDEETSSGFFVKSGQVFYDGKDLGFPAGQIQEFFEKLTKKISLTVEYAELEQITTIEKIRGYKSQASKILEKKQVPYEIITLTNAGYVLRPIIES